MFAINLDGTNRIAFATPEWCKEPDSILVESLPTGETDKEKDITNYLYVGGEEVYKYDPLPDPEPPEPQVDMELVAMQVAYTALMTDTEL